MRATCLVFELAVLGAVAGCAGTRGGHGKEMAPAVSATLGMTPVAATRTAPDAPYAATTLRYATLSIVVSEVAPALDAVERLAHELGGGLSSRQGVSITIHVPRAKFEETLARIEKLGDVTHRDFRVQDLAHTFLDLQERLHGAYAIRDKLTALRATAATNDAVDLEEDLLNVTKSIEPMEGKLKLLRDALGFSTVTVALTAREGQAR